MLGSDHGEVRVDSALDIHSLVRFTKSTDTPGRFPALRGQSRPSTRSSLPVSDTLSSGGTMTHVITAG